MCEKNTYLFRCFDITRDRHRYTQGHCYYCTSHSIPIVACPTTSTQRCAETSVSGEADFAPDLQSYISQHPAKTSCARPPQCSDPSGPVNSCIFVAVLYFPVFRLWSCIFLCFYLLLFSVAFIRLLLKYNMYSPVKDIYTSWFLSTVAECGMLRNTQLTYITVRNVLLGKQDHYDLMEQRPCPINANVATFRILPRYNNA